MRVSLDEYKNDDVVKNVYAFCSAKKIYLARTPSKLILLEKNETKKNINTLNLESRNTVVINKNGMILFPKNR